MSDKTTEVEEKKVESTPSETADTSTETTPKAHKTSKAKKEKSSKGLVYGLTAFVVIVILILGATFIKFGSQTVLAKTFDAIGQHQTAFGLDLLASKGFGGMSKAGAVDLTKPETCKNLYDVTSFSSSDYSAIAGSASLKIEPNNSSFKDKFGYEGYFKGNINFNDIAADIFTDQKVVADSDLIQKANGTTAQPGAKSYGVVTLSGKGEALTKVQEAGYVNLINLAVNTKDFNANGGLNGWYKQDFGFTTDQKAGISDIADVVKRNISVRPETAFSPDTMKEFYAFYCSGLEKVEFGSPKTMTFGSGEYATTKDVRPLFITSKADVSAIYQKGLPNLIDKVGKDATFRAFVKNKYDDFIKIGKASMKLSGTTSTSNPPTKQEFEKSVDQFFDQNLTKESIAKSLESSNTSPAEKPEEMFTLSNKPAELYLAMDTYEPYGAVSSQSITPTAKYLETMGLKADNSLYPLLKDGFTVSAQAYNMTIGANTPKINAPSDAKPFSEFIPDVQKTPAAQRLEQEIQTQNPAQSQMENPYNTDPSAGGRMMYDPNNLPSTTMPLNPDGTVTTPSTLPDGTEGL